MRKMPTLAEMIQGAQETPMPLRLQALLKTNPQAARAAFAAMNMRRKEQELTDEQARRSAAQFMGVRG